MNLITPSFGLLFWMFIGFGILFFVLAKFVWPIIISSITKRNNFIIEQLSEAENVRQEMKNLKAEHNQLLIQAKEERDIILSDARKLRDQMYEDAKCKATSEANEIIESAKNAIHYEKIKAMTDIKNEIANMSIEIAEKILVDELADKSKQEALVSKLMKDIQLN